MKNLSKTIYLFFIYGFFYIPIILLIIFSVNNATFSLVWHGFTWKWYQQLFSDSDLQLVTLHSLFLGILAASISTLLGLLAAVSLYRYKFFGRKLLHGLIFVLIVSPDIVTGISLLILFSTLKISLGFWTLLIAHITLCLPFVVVTVYSRLSGFDENILEAAKDLGARESTIFIKIIAPLLMPALLAGWLLSFSLSLDDVIISYFVTGPDFNILPLQIYSLVRLGVKPEINALCSVLFSLTLFLVIISQLLLRTTPRTLIKD